MKLTDDQRRDVEANLGLVRHVLRTRHVPWYEYEDRFQDGSVGLIDAVMTYDASRGFAFSTHAFYRIRKEVSVGRGREKGKNFRRAMRNGADYVETMLLRPKVDDEGATTDGVSEAKRAARRAERTGCLHRHMLWPMRDGEDCITHRQYRERTVGLTRARQLIAACG